MALSNSQYDSIMRIYNQAQLRQKRELDKRREEVYEKNSCRKKRSMRRSPPLPSRVRDSFWQEMTGRLRGLKGVLQICARRERFCCPPTAILPITWSFTMTARTAVTQATGTGKNATVSRSGRSAFCTISPISGKS